jgi:membrane protein implicated in regulation of membrane protease activity
MKRPDWKVVMRYALFQIPGLVLLILVLILVRRWVDFSPWFFWGSVSAWMVKDVVSFPFVWRAYDWSHSNDVPFLVGTEGIVEEPLAPSGYIRVHGELWQAEVMREGSPIEKGEVVRIQGIRGLVLLVQSNAEKPINEERTTS